MIRFDPILPGHVTSGDPVALAEVEPVHDILRGSTRDTVSDPQIRGTEWPNRTDSGPGATLVQTSKFGDQLTPLRTEAAREHGP